MKRLIRACWNTAHPVRERLFARIEEIVAGCLTRELDSRKHEIEPVLDALLAEHFRLQAQVEELRALLLEERSAREQIPAS